MPGVSDADLQHVRSVALFADKLADSAQFQRLFQDGAALMSEAAAYLGGRGRADSHHLPAHLALTYATESMRLTTRLTQLAAWLLLRRAVHEKALNADQVEASRGKSSWIL